jgi:hypothetical protein
MRYEVATDYAKSAIDEAGKINKLTTKLRQIYVERKKIETTL